MEKKIKFTVNRDVRFRVLDRCFSDFNHEYAIGDLLRECNDELQSQGMTTISERTLRDDIKYMENNQAWNVRLMGRDEFSKGHQRYYRYEERGYSIYNSGFDDDDVTALNEAVNVLNKFMGMPQFDWMAGLVSKLSLATGVPAYYDMIVRFDHSIGYKGSQYIQKIFNAIRKRQSLKIKYHPFNADFVEHVYSPYFLQEYNNRWFLYAYSKETDSLWTLGLDRITEEPKITKDRFIESTIDFNHYFNDVIGATVDISKPVEKVVLKFTPARYKYVVTKPLHHSQRIVDEMNCIVDMNVRINNELIATILYYGKDVEVLEPSSLRQELISIIGAMQNVYSKV